MSCRLQKHNTVGRKGTKTADMFVRSQVVHLSSQAGSLTVTGENLFVIAVYRESENFAFRGCVTQSQPLLANGS